MLVARNFPLSSVSSSSLTSLGQHQESIQRAIKKAPDRRIDTTLAAIKQVYGYKNISKFSEQSEKKKKKSFCFNVEDVNVKVVYTFCNKSHKKCITGGYVILTKKKEATTTSFLLFT